MARGRTTRNLARLVTASEDDGSSDPVPVMSGRRPDELLVEEPLEVRLGDRTVATTMRTPGEDFELAVGFCWSEGLITEAPSQVRYCATGSAVDTEFNVVTVQPAAKDAHAPDATGRTAQGATGRTAQGASGRAASPREVVPRLGLTSSSCGICGSEQIEQLTARLDELPPTGGLDPGLLLEVASTAAGSQALFDLTGGSHAAAAVDLSGSTLAVAEDIGRHNAVDKVVGRLVTAGKLPTPGDPSGAAVLWVSGRASFEMVQKAWAGRFSALVSVGAVSSLAVEMAERAGIVLCGFARGDRFMIYAGAQLLDTGSASPPELQVQDEPPSRGRTATEGKARTQAQNQAPEERR